MNLLDTFPAQTPPVRGKLSWQPPPRSNSLQLASKPRFCPAFHTFVCINGIFPPVNSVNHRARRKRYTLITKLRIANWGRESRTGSQWFNFLEFLVCLLIGSTVSWFQFVYWRIVAQAPALKLCSELDHIPRRLRKNI